MERKIRCLVVDDEPVARDIIMSYIAKLPSLTVVKSCKGVVEALDVMRAETIDLIFLDINMPEVSGLSLARTIQNRTKVIFTTAYREYAVDGFDLQVVDYLLKPISFDRFLKAVHRYFDISTTTKGSTHNTTDHFSSDYFFVRSERKMIKINFDEIDYIESLGDYVKIYSLSGTVLTRETMSNIEAKLPTDKFLRTHRSFIVSMSKISSYTNEFIEVSNKAIPISRSYKEQVLKKLESN